MYSASIPGESGDALDPDRLPAGSKAADGEMS